MLINENYYNNKYCCMNNKQINKINYQAYSEVLTNCDPKFRMAKKKKILSL